MTLDGATIKSDREQRTQLDKFMKEQLIVLNKHIEYGKAANVNVKG